MCWVEEYDDDGDNHEEREEQLISPLLLLLLPPPFPPCPFLCRLWALSLCPPASCSSTTDVLPPGSRRKEL